MTCCDGTDPSTTWVSGGVEWEITTQCFPDETQAACDARHEEAVAYWKEVAPPD